MKKLFSIVLSLTAVLSTASAQSGYPINPVPFTAVKVTDGTFWGQRLQAAREVTVPLAFSKCESEGRYKNFVQCQNPSPGVSDSFNIWTLFLLLWVRHRSPTAISIPHAP